jgi:hypothetical protein
MSGSDHNGNTKLTTSRVWDSGYGRDGNYRYFKR